MDNRLSIDCMKSGPETLLSQLEEAKLEAHVQDHAVVGYGYTRAEVISMVSDYAVHLGKRRVVKPPSLSEQRARCASEESITK